MNVDYAMVKSLTQAQDLATAGTIVPGTICFVVTAGGKKNGVLFVDKAKAVQEMANDEFIFETLEMAQQYISLEGTDAKAGRLITVKEGDKFAQYIIQANASGDGFTLEKPTAASTEPLSWKEF